jgi:hypothetical protein
MFSKQSAAFSIKTIHGRVKAFGQKRESSVGCAGHHFVGKWPFLLGERGQDILRLVAARKTTAYAQTHSWKIFRIQLGDDAPESIMASGASAGSNSQCAELKVNVVGDHENVSWFRTVLFHGQPDDLTAAIHKRQWPNQANTAAPVSADGLIVGSCR